MRGREGFGPGLRAHRERQGLTLEAIARSTKIKASLLAALERNDLSQWPAGIFRRAFLRSYVVALGLSPEPILADFQRFFPEDGTPDAAVFVPDEPMPRPRLELATRAEDLSPAVRCAGAAGIELLLVLALGAGMAWLFGAGFWSTSAWTALAYYPVATALTGRTLGRPQVRLVAWTRWLRRPSAAAGGASFDEARTELPLRDLAAEAEPSDSTDEFRPPQTAVH